MVLTCATYVRPRDPGKSVDPKTKRFQNVIACVEFDSDIFKCHTTFSSD